MIFFLLPNSNKYPDPVWSVGVPGVGAAGSKRIAPQPDTIVPPHTLTPSPKPFSHRALTCALSQGGSVPWLGPPAPAAEGLVGQGESRAVLRGEMRKNRPVTEGGWQLGQGRAQLLVGICREEEDWGYLWVGEIWDPSVALPLHEWGSRAQRFEVPWICVLIKFHAWPWSVWLIPDGSFLTTRVICLSSP